MKDCYDFSKGIKNPYAEKIKKEGYTVTVHYGFAQEERNGMKEYEPTPDEIEAFNEYRNSGADTQI